MFVGAFFGLWILYGFNACIDKFIEMEIYYILFMFILFGIFAMLIK